MLHVSCLAVALVCRLIDVFGEKASALPPSQLEYQALQHLRDEECDNKEVEDKEGLVHTHTHTNNGCAVVMVSTALAHIVNRGVVTASLCLLTSSPSFGRRGTVSTSLCPDIININHDTYAAHYVHLYNSALKFSPTHKACAHTFTGKFLHFSCDYFAHTHIQR